jgi:hypothetical protein
VVRQRTVKSPEANSLREVEYSWSPSPSNELSACKEEIAELQLVISKLEDEGLTKDVALNDTSKFFVVDFQLPRLYGSWQLGSRFCNFYIYVVAFHRRYYTNNVIMYRGFR